MRVVDIYPFYYPGPDPELLIRLVGVSELAANGLCAVLRQKPRHGGDPESDELSRYPARDAWATYGNDEYATIHVLPADDWSYNKGANTPGVVAQRVTDRLSFLIGGPPENASPVVNVHDLVLPPEPAQ